LGTISVTLAPFLYPLIAAATDLRQDCSVYLLEDGLELWLATLHNTKSATPELFRLAENIPPLLSEFLG